MYLKSISLQGFKSFTDKTLVKLEGGISCIVGPNGSGKSNIADAVRWVLGEQSAKTLRGQKMEDVIFAGSDKRKPVGMAEVVLNIDNSDGTLSIAFTEVAICRRTYRSGESEYLINGKQCRLKDLQELFMDTGISNNSLAMVGQGRVHEIVSMRPEERRSLIEEAAGVVKYRNRKKTAVRKLTDTEQNLARLWDIISELAERIEPLQEQSQRAECYLNLKNQADAQELNLLLQILVNNKEQLEKVQQELAGRQELVLTEETEKNLLDSRMEEIKLGLEEKESYLNETQQNLFAAKTNKEREEAKAILLAEKAKSAQENSARLATEIELLLNRDDGFMLQVEQIEAEKIALGKAAAGLAATVAQKEADFLKEKTLLEDLLGQQELTRNEIFDHASRLAHSRNELVYQEQNIAENQVQLKNMTESVAVLDTDKLDFETAFASVQTNLAIIQQKIAAQKTSLDHYDQNLAAIGTHLTAETQKEVGSRLRLNSEQSRLKVLTELHDNLDGYFPGVRALLKAKKQNLPVGTNILGVVVELINAEPKYNMALEAALAGALQHLVVKSANDAKTAVAYLKQEQLGRATFLPLNSLNGSPKRALDNALGQPGVIGRAADIITCEPEIRPVVTFLLANILLVENLDVATKIAKANQQQFKIITLDGDVISPGGAITGGSRQKVAGDLLRKKAQLLELQKSVTTLGIENKAQLAKIALRKAQEEEQLTAKTQAANELRNLELDYFGKEKDLSHLQISATEKERQSKLLVLDLKELKLEQERLIRRKQALETEVKNWQGLTDETNGALASLQVETQTQKEKIDKQQQELETERIVVITKQQEYDHLAGEVARLRLEKKDLFQQEAEKRNALANWENQIVGFDLVLAENQNNLKALAAEILEAEGRFSFTSQEVNATKSKIGELEKSVRNLAKNLEIYRQELHQLELKETRLQTEWENEYAKLAENFQLTYEEALVDLDISISQKELSKNVKELRRQILVLGNVNLDSIQEYQQVFERHSFLAKQREDLLEARNSLTKVITEMDGIMIKRFSQAFQQVNQEFNITFAKLFGGGSAGLAMTMPDDILETGIDMVVQPPGKKLVNYNLLSGGEKSLIGIALVLAIFQVKPSPFCVLDEVDAALDEANVDRFAQYLQEFATKTQFIVVSHRQGTMEVASALWGVTMEADGVSKMVSVKLSDLAV